MAGTDLGEKLVFVKECFVLNISLCPYDELYCGSKMLKGILMFHYDRCGCLQEEKSRFGPGGWIKENIVCV